MNASGFIHFSSTSHPPRLTPRRNVGAGALDGTDGSGTDIEAEMMAMLDTDGRVVGTEPEMLAMLEEPTTGTVGVEVATTLILETSVVVVNSEKVIGLNDGAATGATGVRVATISGRKGVLVKSGKTTLPVVVEAAGCTKV